MKIMNLKEEIVKEAFGGMDIIPTSEFQCNPNCPSRGNSLFGYITCMKGSSVWSGGMCICIPGVELLVEWANEEYDNR